MPRVSVRFYATFREAAGLDGIEIDAEDLEDLFACLIDRLGPAFGRIFRDPEGTVVLVNGRNVRGKRIVLARGDDVAIFPPVSGG